MAVRSQIEFDFPSFAFSLANLPPDLMLRQVEEEIKEISKDTAAIALNDPKIQFWHMDYERKLHRLESFLRTGRPPSDMTPKERVVYEILMECEKKVEASRLRAFELFAELQEEDLTEIAEFCEEVTVPPGTILIRQGQVGKEVYLLEEGSVGVYRGDADTPQFLAVLQAPTLFGEMALLDPERIRTASVTALSPLRLLTIPITSFLLFLRLHSSLEGKLERLISERR